MQKVTTYQRQSNYDDESNEEYQQVDECSRIISWRSAAKHDLMAVRDIINTSVSLSYDSLHVIAISVISHGNFVCLAITVLAKRN